MTDLLEAGSDWLEAQRTAHMAQPVTYTRGALSVDVRATIGRTTFETVDDHGRVIRTESRDFLVLAEELVLGDSPTLPQRGDRVRQQPGNVAFIFEVMAPGGEPHYRFSDPYRKTLRIHTKLVDTEVTP